MKNRTARTQGAREPGTMTLRVYTVSPDGIVISDRGTESVAPGKTLPFGGEGFPPCQCPRHTHRDMAAPR
ncbi:hypothetical protein [Streptomyces sp. NPDC004528]|uniref:hypothetical protein n=1 Tax=Streptomyces sp. NPDC004528 TaxID=3154550 RepID=UPI0033BC38DE